LFLIDASFLVNSHLDHSRTWIPACSLTAAALLHRCFPSNLFTTMQGAIVKLRGTQTYAFCSSDQCRTVKLRLPAVRELFWSMLIRGGGGWRGIGVSGSGYNEVLALEVRNVI